MVYQVANTRMARKQSNHERGKGASHSAMNSYILVRCVVYFVKLATFFQ